MQSVVGVTNEPSAIRVIEVLTAAIGRAASATAIYDAALDGLQAGLGIHRAAILLFDPDRVMRFKAWRGLSEPYRRAVEGHTPWTPDTPGAETIIVSDVTREPSLTTLLSAIEAEGIGGMVFVPLKSATGVLGKFMLYHAEPRAFSDVEVSLAAIIAGQVAFAVQRMRADHAARDRESELRVVTDLAPVFITHSDRQRRYKFVNRPFAARFGMVPQQVIGRTITDVLGAGAYETIREHVDAVLDGSPVQFEAEIALQRTGTRVVDAQYVPERDASGQVSGFISVVTDITERRQAEKALRSNEAMFRQLADTLPQMVWMAGADGQVDYFNERWYAFTRRPRGDAAWLPAIHPDDRQRTADTWDASVRSGNPYEIEYRFLDPRSGGYVWFLGRALPLRDSDGHVVRWFGTCTNIDDQKRAEQASRFLAEASRMLAEIGDRGTALEALARRAVPEFADWCAADVVEPSGGFRRVALAATDPMQTRSAAESAIRYGPRRHDPYGAGFVIRSGTAQLLEDVGDEILTACAHDPEHLARLRGAGLRSMISVPVKAADRVVAALTFLTSDSRRRYGAADLAVAQELAHRAGMAIDNARLYADLRRADRQKDEFLAVLAHELRNPLAPIRTALHLLRLAPDDQRRRERACEIMDRQLLQLVRLVDDLLDVSRITRGKIQLQKQRVDLSTVIRNAIETSRPMIEAAGHELATTMPTAQIVLDADATRLAQVLSNLLNNAAKYTPAGGRIAIAAEQDGAAAVVRVQDSGIGIPADMLARIFEMFTQVDRSIEKAHGGLGIGLTLARRLVALHGGSIEARSDGPGRGSEFVLRLPIAGSAEMSGNVGTTEPPASACPPRRVLVVDDNRDAADSLADVLRLRHHDVRVAYDGLTGLDVAAEFRPDVVLMDLGMPGMSGYAAARQLRERLPAGVVLVAVTGFAQEEHRRLTREVGFDSHLVKPVDIDTVERLLREAV